LGAVTGVVGDGSATVDLAFAAALGFFAGGFATATTAAFDFAAAVDFFAAGFATATTAAFDFAAAVGFDFAAVDFTLGFAARVGVGSTRGSSSAGSSTSTATVPNNVIWRGGMAASASWTHSTAPAVE